MTENYKTLLNKKGYRIAYNKTENNTKKPGIIFLSGFNSDMSGNKALFLEKKCIETNRQFIRFDYSGHGKSDGDFRKCNISVWLDDVIIILKQLTSSPQILVGSSMGGWLALLATIQAPHLVSAIVCVAAAPDFTKRIFEEELSKKQKLDLEHYNQINLTSEYSEEEYLITKNLIEDGNKYLMLENKIKIAKPVRLIHGTNDTSVPLKDSLKLLDALETDDAELTLVKNGDHRLSSIKNLNLIWNTITTFAFAND
tara:strand:- start:360 stop:1124 length:765 start_codon:yes stop_codon:yes gene_type:complete